MKNKNKKNITAFAIAIAMIVIGTPLVYNALEREEYQQMPIAPQYQKVDPILYETITQIVTYPATLVTDKDGNSYYTAPFGGYIVDGIVYRYVSVTRPIENPKNSR